MEETLDKLEKKHGGVRAGAGMPKGKKTRKTIQKEIELAYIKERVSRAKETIIDAQLSLARGLSYLYRIDKDAKGNNKKPELVTAQYEIEAYLSGEADEDSYYYITTVRPENNAIDSLLDRTVGKPIQKNQIEGKLTIVEMAQEIIKKHALTPGTINDSE